MSSPILIDTGRNGYKLTDVSGGVQFDLDADGIPEQVSWTHQDSDEAFLALAHAGGAVSHVSVGSVFGAPGPRRRVLAERGAYVVDLLDSQEDQLRSGLAADDPGFGVEPEERWGRLHRGDDVARVPSEAGRWRDFYPAVLSALVDGTPPPVDPADAVEVLRVLEAARRSSDSGSTVEL